MARALGLVLLAAVLAGLLVWSRGRTVEPKVSGYVEADEIRVGSRVGGRVKSVNVAEGAVVKPGDVLVELAPFDLVERRAGAVAELAARRAEAQRLTTGARAEEIEQGRARVARADAFLDRLVHGPRKQEIDTARAEVGLAATELERARRTFERTRSLAGKGTSEDDVDRAGQDVAAAEASLEVQKLALAVLEEGSRAEDVAAARAERAEAVAALDVLVTGARVEDVMAARAAEEAAAAAVAVLDRQIDELSIRAPCAAVVDAVDLREGDLVAANAPVLSLVDRSRLWVRAYLPEGRLDVATGAEVSVAVDAFPGRRFRARAAFVASEAEFTPGNVQTPDERAKQVFRMKVVLEEGTDVLRPGMSADVWLPAR